MGFLNDLGPLGAQWQGSWLLHGPRSASSDGCGALWHGSGWHALTTAQNSRERGTLLREPVSSGAHRAGLCPLPSAPKGLLRAGQKETQA